MTIHLNLTPKEAQWLHTQTAGLAGVAAGLNTKLTRQVHKFATVTQEPAPVKFPGTGNVDLAKPPITADLLQQTLTAALAGRDINCFKIAAIKAIREVAEMGLADAKWAVENWQAFIAFVRAAGRLPQPGWSYSPMR